MSEHDSDKQTIQQFIEIEAYYEVVAGQEEVYLEETEEELRMILTFDDDRDVSKPPDPKEAVSHRAVEVSGGELLYAAEELVVGDSDDAPLSEEAVNEMLRDISKDFKP